MSNTETITWIHLSDLLSSARRDRDAGHVLGDLRNDLKRLQSQHDLRPELVFVTGDVAIREAGVSTASLATQLEEAWFFLEELQESFDPKISSENLFIVPGNHDVERAEDLHNATGWLDGVPGKSNADKANRVIRDGGALWTRYMRGLEVYREFLNQSGYKHLLQDSERLLFGHLREVNGHKVGIAGLNTAWSCSGGEEVGSLLFGGAWQIETITPKIREADIRIVLLHHPIRSLIASEGSALRSLFDSMFHFHLHGHAHEAWVAQSAGGPVCIAAGSIADVTKGDFGYNVVRVDPAQRKVEIFLRNYDQVGGGWIPVVIYDRTDKPGSAGIWQLGQLPTLSSTEITTTPPDARPVTAISELDAKDWEAPTIEEGPESRGVFGRRKTTRQIARLLESRPIGLLYGLRGIGKTRLVDEVRRCGQHSALRYESIRVLADMNFDDLYEHIAVALGSREERPRPLGVAGRIDLSAISTWIRHRRPCLIHLHRADRLFGRRGWHDPRVSTFLLGIADRAPEVRIIMESLARPPASLLSSQIHFDKQIHGLGTDCLAEYFRKPFPGDPDVGWILTQDEIETIADRLGSQRGRQKEIYPIAMFLLASIAARMRTRPQEVLTRCRDAFDQELNTSLFDDLYENTLTKTQQRLLCLCALYREEVIIPRPHVERLERHSGALEGEDPFARLVQRCIMTEEGEDGYYLHGLIRELARRRLPDQSSELQVAHECIADAWRSQLRISGRPTLPNIKATNETAHHLILAERFDRLNELSAKMMSRGIAEYLNESQRSLFNKNKFEDQRAVLELWSKLDPNNFRAHRFLGECIERLHGKGATDALRQYLIALDLNPGDKGVLASFGSCLRARGEEQEFCAYINRIKKHDQKKVLRDDYVATEYSLCLERIGDGKAASALRRQRIAAGSRHPGHYNSEARYLAKEGHLKEALEVLDQAAKIAATNLRTLTTRAIVLERLGEHEDSSRLRRRAMEEERPDPEAFIDEARFLRRQGRLEEALVFLDQAEKIGAAPDYVANIRAAVLEQQGHGEKASRLRRELIQAGTRNPAIYNDEARYLIKQRRFLKALDVLEQGEGLGVADDRTFTIRAALLDEFGEGEAGSKTRRRRIEAGTRNPAIFAEEALFLKKRRRLRDALAVLDQAAAVGAMNDYIVSIRAGLLDELGTDAGSILRQERIAAGSRNVVFYADEAQNLKERGRFEEALEILDKAEAVGVTNDFTVSIRASVLEKIGVTDAASSLRQERIAAGSKHPAIYNDEAKYLLQCGRLEVALEVLGKAEEAHAMNDATPHLRDSILSRMKNHNPKSPDPTDG